MSTFGREEDARWHEKRAVEMLHLRDEEARKLGYLKGREKLDAEARTVQREHDARRHVKLAAETRAKLNGGSE